MSTLYTHANTRHDKAMRYYELGGANRTGRKLYLKLGESAILLGIFSAFTIATVLFILLWALPLEMCGRIIKGIKANRAEGRNQAITAHGIWDHVPNR